MWISFFLLLLAFIAEGHKCIHDDSKDAPVEITPQEYKLPSSNKRVIQDSERFSQPLRIHVDTENLEDDFFTCYKAGDTCHYYNSATNCVCNPADVLTPKKRELLDKYLAEAVAFFERTLSVIPVQNGLRPNNNLISARNCDRIRISPKYINGIDAEYLLFVTSRPIAEQGVVAAARYCQVDHLGSRGGRPIVGIINIQPLHLQEGEQYHFSETGVFIHEIGHALGFTSAKFDSGFIRWEGNKYRDVEAKEISKSYYHPGIGHMVNRIVTPNVRDAARAHFGCPDLDGAELEARGGNGTFRSHWEKRVFQNEFMTGSQSPFPVYSNITLSLFKDMGWYGIQDHPIQTLHWGHKMGCSFCNTNCSEWPRTSQQEGYRCTNSDPREQCSWDLRGWGTCSSENPGILDEPGCEYYAPTPNTYCHINTKIITFTLPSGEVYSSSSRCFHSSLVALPKFATFIYFPQLAYMQCYPTICTGLTQLKVSVDSVWYDCPYQGGSIFPIDYGGSITCPPRAADIICASNYNRTFDVHWPQFARVVPSKAMLGNSKQNSTQILIQGRKFTSKNLMVTVGGVNCSDIQVIDSETITAFLPTTAEFSSIRALGPSSTRLSIVIYDEKGRTAVGLDAIQLTIQTDGADIEGFFARLGVSHAAFLAILLVSLSICIFSIIGFAAFRYYRGKLAQTLNYQRINTMDE